MKIKGQYILEHFQIIIGAGMVSKNKLLCQAPVADPVHATIVFQVDLSMVPLTFLCGSRRKGECRGCCHCAHCQARLCCHCGQCQARGLASISACVNSRQQLQLDSRELSYSTDEEGITGSESDQSDEEEDSEGESEGESEEESEEENEEERDINGKRGGTVFPWPLVV